MGGGGALRHATCDRRQIGDAHYQFWTLPTVTPLYKVDVYSFSLCWIIGEGKTAQFELPQKPMKLDKTD